MADINLVFGGGWPPSELNDMSLDELMRWHGIAAERNQQQIDAMRRK